IALRCPRRRLRRDPATRAADTARERGVGGDLRRDFRRSDRAPAVHACAPRPRSRHRARGAHDRGLEGQKAHIVLIDNINRPLGSGALDTALTGTAWSERILGKSEKIDLQLLTIWYATGNNVTFKGDAARRCLHVRPDSVLEKPEYRDASKHPKLLTGTEV